MQKAPSAPTRSRPRLPAFHPVPIRTRADGWTPVRQAEFIGMLAETGSVSAAAAYVGLARETAYRLRRKPGAEEFTHAWDMALVIAGGRSPLPRAGGSRPSPLPLAGGSRSSPLSLAGGAGGGPVPAPQEGRTRGSRKVSPAPTWRMIVDGWWRPVLRGGKYAGSVHTPDNCALLRYVAQLDRSVRAERKALRRELRSHR